MRPVFELGAFWAILQWMTFAMAYAVDVPTTQAQTAAPPNIVLIVADDLGIFDLGCYGRDEHRTPNLDRLASGGLRYTSAYCAQPICSASRAALLTSKYPARLHLTTYLPGRADAPSQQLLQPRIEPALRSSEITIAELLRQAGYATGIFGKWHLGDGDSGPKAQGFDTVLEPSASGKLDAVEGNKNEYAIADAAARFISENATRPYFCYVPHHAPHIPLAASAEALEANRQAWNPLYAAAIESLDASIGRVLDAVEKSPNASNTIVIFTSDNGCLHVPEGHREPLTHAGPFRAGKGFLYEGGTRVPYIVRWPASISQARVVDTPVSLLDSMPTLLELAGIDRAKTVGPLDGISIASQWRPISDPAIVPNSEDRTFYWHFPHYTNQGSRPAGAIRRGPWKLIHDYESNRLELYDLRKDPSESQNRIDADSAVALTLVGDLKTWRQSVGAQECTPNPDANEKMHRSLYEDFDPSQLRPTTTNKLLGDHWAPWRTAMNQAIQNQKPKLKRTEGAIELLASKARAHGKNLRYEPETYKNVLGYWTEVDDWADWEVDIPDPGVYEVEVHVGCGVSTPGSRAAVVANQQRLEWAITGTGHFQNIIIQNIGTMTLKEGVQTIEVRPIVKAGVAIMDIRAIILRPVDMSTEP